MNKYLSRFFLALAVFGLAFSCQPPDDPQEPGKPQVPEVIKYRVPALSELTLEQKVGQLFNIRVENLIGSTTAATQETSELTAAFAQYPCGGFTLFAANIKDPDQLLVFTKYLHGLGSYPLLCIDEEGGTVARIGRNANFHVQTFSSMGDIGASGSLPAAFNAGSAIGSYLFQYGLDVDLAPVADVNSNPNNPVIGKRSFSSDPDVAADMSSQFLLGLKHEKVEGCLKHFPGHGDTSTDTHTGFADTQKTWEEMLACEMIPFKKGIQNGAKMVMTAHIACPKLNNGSEVPSTLSSVVLQDKLRGELGFKGVIITDAMEMGAITQNYTVEDAAVLAIQAGADIVLCPGNYPAVYNYVLSAVRNGNLSEARVDESVTRILALKKEILKTRGLLEE